MANFGKHEDCPTSEELLAFQNGDIPVNESGGIRRHLADCEFCASEVEFYSHYPPSEVPEEAPSSEIPAPLFELATSLLNNKS